MQRYSEETGGNPDATIIGFDRKTTAPLAALVNGTFAHALDFDDSNDSLMGHPSGVILATVLALGEKLVSSGEAILESFVIGWEVACKIGKGVNPQLYRNGWHSTNVIGVLGATAAAAKLLGFGPDQTAVALGIAASLSSGLRANFGTMTKPFHAGKAAENAIVAVHLTSLGFTASSQILESDNGFCQVFSGKYDLARTISDFANPWEIVSPGPRVKPYPSCLETHSIIEATLSTVQSQEILPEDVESVECRIAPLAANILIHQKPLNQLQGKFSAQYAVATALVYRKASLDEFSDKAVQNPVVQSVIKKVAVIPDPDLEQHMQSAIVTIRLHDGRRYTKRVDDALGHPENPMFLDQIIDKYKNCAVGTISEDNIERSINEILDFEKVKNLGRLLTLLGGNSEVTQGLLT